MHEPFFLIPLKRIHVSEKCIYVLLQFVFGVLDCLLYHCGGIEAIEEGGLNAPKGQACAQPLGGRDHILASNQ